ncbi:helix-turn-helix domain-containing protein [Demetria terragena]|uniref:helix-turn-helix domain-containing protein n=1 Tax=Demetria terragena TaxID=63959 RepID=UPI000361A4E0|nr:LysR family transcriptional regulator [Demetria terragena]
MLTNLQTLRSFVTLVRAGSIHRAARRLHYSPSTVRAHVRDLEHQLRVTLVDRKRPDQLLTPEAEELAPKMFRAVESIAALEEHAASTAEQSPATPAARRPDHSSP